VRARLKGETQNMNIKQRAYKNCSKSNRLGRKSYQIEVEGSFPEVYLLQTTNASWLMSPNLFWKGTSGNKNHITSLLNILRQKMLK
jgi:hypothetical protein